VRGRGRKRSAPESERGVLLTLLLKCRKDAVAGIVASAAVVAILVNALMLQAGRHPSPMFETTVASPIAVAPAPAPRAMPAAPASETTGLLPRPRPAEARAADSGKADDPMGALVRTTSQSGAGTVHTDATPAANGSARVAAVQRALTDYGYGQLKATGTIGADTQAAIQRFERERKLPITGQMSDRLVKELGLATGKPIP
jgi:hypothetical protein